MIASEQTPYKKLEARWSKMHHLGHLQAMASWDQATMMPTQSNEARAQAMTELTGVLHGLITDPQILNELNQAVQVPVTQLQAGNLREMRNQWTRQNALPAQLVRDKKMATARCEHAWRGLRAQNDWHGFVPLLKPVVSLVRQEAHHLSQKWGISTYEAMLEQYEPGLRIKELDQSLGSLKNWLPALIEQAVKVQAGQRVQMPQGPFSIEQQKKLCMQVMRGFGFNFEAGRLDVSAHPFCGGVPEDVRITTRFRTDECLSSLYGTIHETGHALYEQNLPREWLGQPAARARSMAIHESQSLFFELQLGRHPAFVQWLAPQLSATFGAQDAWEPDNLALWLNRVEPGLIRVDADEVTYPAHILIRYGIEKALIDGDIEVEDIPALWDSGMAHWLGIDTRGNFKDGPMQDIHWTLGAFGYFPCYTLGAMYAAQWHASMKNLGISRQEDLQKGEFGAIKNWLKNNIWSQASFWPTDELVVRASKETLNPAHYKAHLAMRYL